MKWKAVILLCMCGFISFIYVMEPPALNRLLLKLEDTKFFVRRALNLEPRISDQVVVVAIDEKSVNELGRWPWDRRVIAALIRNLAPAKAVALDVVFSEPSTRESDLALAKAIEESGNVVLGFFFRTESSQEMDPLSLDLLFENEFLNYRVLSESVGIPEMPHVELSLPAFLEVSAGLGFINVESDPDATYRNYSLAYLYNGSIFLPLALQTFRLYTGKEVSMEIFESGINLKVDGERVPVHRGRFLKINFYSPEQVNIVPAVDLIKGRVRADVIKNKAVFVGATEIGIFDLRPTPVDPALPGVFLHAFAFSNFLEGHFIRHDPLMGVLFIFFSGTLVILISRLKGFSHRAVLYLLSLPLTFVIPYVFFSFGGYDLPISYALITFGLSMVFSEGWQMLISERRIRELRRAFSSYVSPEVLEIITRDPSRLKLGGEKREVTVLFSDIRGFTSLSEEMKPEDLVALLNEYLTPMTEIVLQKGGMLDKYIGDAIMAVFNAPVDLEDHPKKACECALEMVRELKRLNGKFKTRYGIEMGIGVGINTGEAVVGNMGSFRRFDYTAIGDTVNLASRLEGLNKVYGTSILISQFTNQRLDDKFLTRKIDKVMVKGKRKAVEIYELMEHTEENRRLKLAFEKALELYFRGNFEDAKLLFEEVIITFGDKTSAVFYKRCEEMIKNPPQRWEGIFVAREK